MGKPARKLVLLRHGQAQNAAPSASDFDRPLTDLGKHDAENAGNILAQIPLLPDYILCSPTRRTRETLAEVQKTFQSAPQVEYAEKIYHAYDRDLLSLIASCNEEVKNLLLIGHNPALHQLAFLLAQRGEQKLLDKLSVQFPPCTLVVLSFFGEWNGIDSAEAELEILHFPEMA